MNGSFPKRAKTPTIIQMEAVECGAASLGIILAYMGRFVTLEELRISCGITRDGSTIYNLKRAALQYGLDAKAYKRSMEDLFDLPGPFIVFWGYNHFLVVEGFTKDSVYLNDPATGPRKISYDEFEKMYSGVMVTFEKTEAFKEGGQLPSVWPGMIDRLRKVTAPLKYLIFAGFCLMLTNLFYPGFTKVFFDTILGEQIFSWSDWFVFAFFTLAVLVGLLIWLQQYLLIRLSSKLSIIFSSDYLKHILKLPLTFYQQRFGGEIAYRISLNDTMIDILTGKLATTVISLVFVVLYMTLMFGFSKTIATVVLFTSIVNFLAVVLMQRFRNDAYARLQQDFGKYYGYAIGGIYYIESIKATGIEIDFFSRLIGYFNRSVTTEQALAERNSYMITLPYFLQALTTTALFGIGGWLIMADDFTIGLFMALQILITNFNTPVVQLSGLGEDIQTLKIDMARVDDVMKNPEDPLFLKETEKEAKNCQRLSGQVELRDISYGYSPLDPPLISDFNLQLKPGMRIALIGPTGCGKTTLAKIISGLLPPRSGELLFDGRKREEYSREEIISSLATVDQEIFLFAGTIRDNITLFDYSYSDEEILHAAKSACLHEEILQKPKGYDYMLTEGGSNLSGGQRQRVEIARAFLLNPSILLLDEATSALDSGTEEKIIKNIRQRGISCIMVAHRLSTIRDCDEIIVLQEGKIVQRGVHESLKDEEGPYRELVSRDV